MSPPEDRIEGILIHLSRFNRFGKLLVILIKLLPDILRLREKLLQGFL